MRKMTQKQKLENLKNKRFVALTFENGRRIMTYSGLNAIGAAEHCASASLRGNIAIIVADGILTDGMDIERDMTKIIEFLKTRAV